MPAEGERLLNDQEMYEMKQEAAKYFAKNQVPERLEEILNALFYEKPEDVYGRLSRHFESMASPARIMKVEASSVMDSTGSPSVGCKMHCMIRNESRLLSSTNLSVDTELRILPQPTAESEEKEPSKESAVTECIKFIESVICEKLKGHCPMHQREIDTILRKLIDDEEAKLQPASTAEGEEEQRTPTPSSGPKKKPPSGKGKGKANEKPVPPFEPPEFRMQGCSAVPATSISALRSSANFLEKPVFEHLHNVTNLPGSLTLPVPSINVISGGKSYPGKLNIAKNVFVISKPGLTMEESVTKLTQIFHQVGKSLTAKTPVLPPMSTAGGYQPNFEKIEQPLDLINEAVTTLGWTLGQDFFIGIDCAAHEVFDYGKGKYEITAGALKSADEIIDFYRDILNRYPSIIALIDPLRKEDREQWPRCCETLTEKCYILGSDAVYGSTHGITSNVLETRRSSGIFVNLGGRATVCDIIDAAQHVRDRGGVVVLASLPGDVCDTVFTDLAVGLNCDMVRFGGPCRGENTARLDRLIEIERHAKASDVNYRKKFKFPHVKPPTPPPPAEDDLPPQPPPSNVASSAASKKR